MRIKTLLFTLMLSAITVLQARAQNKPLPVVAGKSTPKLPVCVVCPATIKGLDASEENIVLEEKYMVPVAKDVQMQETILEKGVPTPVTVVKKVTAYETKIAEKKHSLKNAVVLTGEGQELMGATRTKTLLDKSKTVVVGFGTEIDPVWFNALKPDTVILLLAPAHGTAQPVAMPAPAPLGAAPLPAPAPRPVPPQAQVPAPAPAPSPVATPATPPVLRGTQPKAKAYHVSPTSIKGLDASKESVLVEIKETYPITKTVTVPVTKTIDGVQRQLVETKQVVDWVINKKEVKHPLKNARVYLGDGKELADPARTAALEKPRTVMFGFGEEVDPEWFESLKPDAVVLLVPMPIYGMPAPAAPAMPTQKSDSREPMPAPAPSPVPTPAPATASPSAVPSPPSAPAPVAGDSGPRPMPQHEAVGQSVKPVLIDRVDLAQQSIILAQSAQVTYTEIQRVKEKYLDNGVEKEVEKEVPITKMKTVTQARAYPLKSARIYSGDGKELTGPARDAALVEGATIAFGTGFAPEPGWFKILSPKAVLVMVPPPAAGPSPMPAREAAAPPVDGAPPDPDIAAAPKPADPLRLSAEEKQVLDLTNAERQKEKLAPFKINAKLLKAARDHSTNMANKNQLAHELDGKGPAERVKDLGYRYQKVGENCAAGQNSPKEAIESWMSSSGHKANILDSQYMELGIGLAKGSDGTIYWTQVFGKSPEQPQQP